MNIDPYSKNIEEYKKCDGIINFDNESVKKYNRPLFGHNCVSCGACMQHCPKNAIHHEKEKSSGRYRNPHIDLAELKYR